MRLREKAIHFKQQDKYNAFLIMSCRKNSNYANSSHNHLFYLKLYIQALPSMATNSIESFFPIIKLEIGEVRDSFIVIKIKKEPCNRYI